METNHQHYWEERYREGQTGWDIGSASTPLARIIDQINDKNAAILIPGCGNAYEAEYLLQKGFTNITLVDIAEAPVEAMRKKFATAIQDQTIKIIHRNFFDLQSSFDVILEQTFYCALPPSLRSDYVKKMHALLNQNGRLTGVLLNFPLTEQGPPFGGSIEEYRTRFSPYFRLNQLEPCTNSIPPRAGREVVIEFEKLSEFNNKSNQESSSLKV